MYSWAEVHEFLSLDLLEGEVADALFGPRFNVAPSQDVLVARAASPTQAELVPMRWGFVPSWAKDAKRASINARSETVATNGMFRTAFKKRRCLIPVSGFYEWQAIEGSTRKQPWYFYPAHDPLFAFGGLWEEWGEGAERVATVAIVTTAANEFVEPIHDRMPLIVPRKHHAQWLFGEPDVAAKLMVPALGTSMAAHRVTEKVNNPRAGGRELIEVADAK
jgi:putative SOS response-associated peptidase YedK